MAILVAFARRRRHLEYPLIDVGLFRDRVFTVAVVTGLLPLAAWSATAYLSGVYLQTVLDMSVFQAAVLAVPGALVLTVTCIVTPMVVGRTGTRSALTACHFASAAGMSLFLMTSVTGGAGRYVAGPGHGISFAVLADLAVAARSPASGPGRRRPWPRPPTRSGTPWASHCWAPWPR